MDALAPFFRLSLEASRTVVGPLFGGGPLLVVGFAATQAFFAWSAARRRAQEVRGTRGLQPGPILVKGVAERDEAFADETGPLIELVIEQQGTERRVKGGTLVVWREVSRTLRERPFLLRTERNERVRVEPGGRLDLVDGLEPPQRGPGAAQRRREAKISVGDTVWVGGVLTRSGSGTVGPYRGGGERAGHVLRPPARGALFVSSEPVEHQGLADAKFHRLFALLALALLVIAQGILFRDFHALRARGVRGEASVVGQHTWITRNKNSVTRHYGLKLAYDVGSRRYEREEETNAFAYRELAAEARVPIVYLPSSPDTMQLGGYEELGTTEGRTTIASFMGLALVVAYVLAAAQRQPWWRRGKLVETENGKL